MLGEVTSIEEDFYEAIDIVAEQVYNEQVKMGFHDSLIPGFLADIHVTSYPGSQLEKAEVELNSLEDTKRLCLIIGEVSEAVEAIRKNITVSEHIPEFTGLEEELADTVICILDLAGQRQLRLGEAIKAKLSYNKTRGYKHGGKKF